MGGLHWYDLLPLIVIALLVFGPKRLPEMGSAIGKTIKEFRKSMNEVTEPTNPTPAVPPAATSAQPPALPASVAPSVTPTETTSE
jgi:TatA/E family protein of Tat protein translocase